MKLELKYAFGDLFILKTDKDKRERMLVSATFSPNGVRYCLVFNDVESWHYEIEFEVLKANSNTAGFKINNNHEKEKEKTTVQT